MLDPFARQDVAAIVPAKKLYGTVKGLLIADGDTFITRRLDLLPLTFDGIPDDRHNGPVRRSGGQEPWYPRGTPMRNERQMSVISVEECAEVARRLGIDEIKPEWIGANLVVAGIPALSMLPAGSLIFFEGGVTIHVAGNNPPCRISGKSIADHVGERPDIELAFPQQAKYLRGIVGWVEKEGTIRDGEAFHVRVPEQWIYEG